MHVHHSHYKRTRNEGINNTTTNETKGIVLYCIVMVENRVELENLPEGCIANVISFTTPRDACALSLVSSTFRSAAQSDVVWERFLPSDYRSIISQSETSLNNLTSKKDLYLHLCHQPLLIDAAKKSFAVEKLSGKKCYMLSARALSIVWSDTPRFWRWISLPESRFPEVAELVSVCWLEIRGWIKCCMLSEETLYGAYLVYKTSVAGSYGFGYQPVEVSVGISGESNPSQIKISSRTVYLEGPKTRRLRRHHRIIPRRPRFRLMGSTTDVEESEPPPQAPQPATEDVNSIRGGDDGVKCPKERGDGWWEIELGEFFNGGKDDKDVVEMTVYEVKSGDWKGGLIVQGIEIRPKLTRHYLNCRINT